MPYLSFKAASASFFLFGLFEGVLMSRNSPGQNRCPWTASLWHDDLPLDMFLRSGVISIPIALVPMGGHFIKLNTVKTIQEHLHALSLIYQIITDVWQFGRGGIVCRSADQEYVKYLFKCSSFAPTPASAVVTPHLACTKNRARCIRAA